MLENKISKSHFYLNLDFQSVLKERLHCEYIRPFHSSLSLSPQVSSSYVTLTDSSRQTQSPKPEKNTHTLHAWV